MSTAEGTSSSSTMDSAEKIEALKIAADLLAQGKRSMVCEDVPKAVNLFEEAVRLLVKECGEMSRDCADAYFNCGSALLELGRMETNVLGTALEGVEVEEEKEEEENEQFEKPPADDDNVRQQLREEVYEAMAEGEREEQLSKIVHEKAAKSTTETIAGETLEADKKKESSEMKAGMADVDMTAESDNKGDGDCIGDASSEKKVAESEKKDAAESEKKDAAESEKKDAAESEKKDAAESEKNDASESEKNDAAESEKKDAAESEKKDAAESEKKDAAESEKKDAAESEKKDAAESEKKDAAESEKKDAAESKKKDNETVKKDNETVKGSDSSNAEKKEPENNKEEEAKSEVSMNVVEKEAADKAVEPEKKDDAMPTEVQSDKVTLGSETKDVPIEKKEEEMETTDESKEKSDKSKDKEDEKVEEVQTNDAKGEKTADGAAEAPVNGTKEEEEKENDVEMADAEAVDEGEEDGEEGEETADGEESQEGEGTEEKDEDVPNFQLAWEYLDLAKVIYLKSDSKDDQLKAAECHIKLGEVSMETEQHATAAEDLQSALKIQQKYLPADDRLIAETHYQLGLAYGLSKDFKLSIEHYQLAISTIEAKIASLTKLVEEQEIDADNKENHETDELKKYKDEIKELQDLIPEMRNKIEDTQVEATDMEKMKEMAKEMLGLSGTTKGFGSPTKKNVCVASAGPDVDENGEKKASDIAHLVRKKRKPEDDTEAPAALEIKKIRQEDGAAGDSALKTNGDVKVNGNGETPINVDKVTSDVEKTGSAAAAEPMTT